MNQTSALLALAKVPPAIPLVRDTDRLLLHAALFPVKCALPNENNTRNQSSILVALEMHSTTDTVRWRSKLFSRYTCTEDEVVYTSVQLLLPFPPEWFSKEMVSHVNICQLRTLVLIQVQTARDRFAKVHRQLRLVSGRNCSKKVETLFLAV